MGLRVVTLIVAGLLAAACEPVSVNVPPEADLQGIKTVAVVAADMPYDPQPVAGLLRGEASSRIRRLLPHLTLVEPTANADAIVRMTVVRHGLGPASVRVYVDPKTNQVSCSAWQMAWLFVDASVVTGETIRWQGILQAERRLNLPCIRRNVPVIVYTPAENIDPRLVHDVVDDLGRRLAGYVRTEFRAMQNPPPPPPADDEVSR